MEAKTLRPNNTYRFTLLSQPEAYMAELPKKLAEKIGKTHTQRYTIYVMPDDSIFFEKLNISTFVCKEMLSAIVRGVFDDKPRYEVTVNDTLYGRYVVTPLDWEALALTPYYEGEYEEYEDMSA